MKEGPLVAGLTLRVVPLLAALLLLAGCSVMRTSARPVSANAQMQDARTQGTAERTNAAEPPMVEWPQHVCTADEAVEDLGGSNYRPRLMDEVGPSLPFALLMPVEGAATAEVYPSFGGPRSGGRLHEGVDIMAPRGTPVRPAAPGFVTRLSTTDLGGISATLVGDGGVRYFYTHFDALAPGLEVGQYVDVDTVIGYVGNTGNAASTAPHLHFGVYLGGLGAWCGWRPIDPLPLLLDRIES